MFFGGETEKMTLVAERDLWIGHGPRSSFPPRRARTGFQSILSNRSTMETVALRPSKSIGRRRPPWLRELVCIAWAWKSACCSRADGVLRQDAEKPMFVRIGLRGPFRFVQQNQRRGTRPPGRSQARVH